MAIFSLVKHNRILYLIFFVRFVIKFITDDCDDNSWNPRRQKEVNGKLLNCKREKKFNFFYNPAEGFWSIEGTVKLETQWNPKINRVSQFKFKIDEKWKLKLKRKCLRSTLQSSWTLSKTLSLKLSKRGKVTKGNQQWGCQTSTATSWVDGMGLQNLSNSFFSYFMIRNDGGRIEEVHHHEFWGVLQNYSSGSVLLRPMVMFHKSWQHEILKFFIHLKFLFSNLQSLYFDFRANCEPDNVYQYLIYFVLAPIGR